MKKYLTIILLVSLITMLCFSNIALAVDDEDTENTLENSQSSEEETNNNEEEELTLNGIILNFKNVKLNLKSSETWGLVVQGDPNGVTIPEIVWTSSDTKIVIVNPGATSSTATLTPVSVGSATVTAKTVDNKYSVTCEVKVTDGELENINTTDETIDNGEVKTPSETTPTADTTTATGTLPQTGFKAMSIAAIISLTAFGVLSYKKYKTLKGI